MADFGITEAIAIAGVVAAAGSAYASYAAGQAGQEAGKYNAAVAERQAEEAKAQAKINAENQARASQREQATVRARAADAGVNPSYGSPLLTLMDNARLSELENQRLLYGGDVRAGALKAGAGLALYQGQTAAKAGAVGAGINLLSGVASTGYNYYRPTISAAKLAEPI